MEKMKTFFVVILATDYFLHISGNNPYAGTYETHTNTARKRELRLFPIYTEKEKTPKLIAFLMSYKLCTSLLKFDTMENAERPKVLNRI
nr:uncharacterized protein LOC106838513 isoform X2 [Equus asinus]